MVRRGLLEDREQWIAFEMKWDESGLTLSDIVKGVAGGRLSVLGAMSDLDIGPGGESSMSYIRFAEALLTNVEKYPQTPQREEILRTSMLAVIVSEPLSHLGLLNRVAAARRRLESDEFCIYEKILERDWPTWLAFLDEVGRSPKLHCGEYFGDPDSVPIKSLSEAFLGNPQRWGLLRLIAYWHAAGSPVPEGFVSRLRIEPLSDETLRSVVLLTASSSDVKEATQVVPLIHSVMQDSADRAEIVEALLSCLQVHGRSAVTLELILPVIEQELREDEVHLRGQVGLVRLGILQGLSSGFQRVRLMGLGLPAV